jgi:uncharacterized protein YceH (UPF0502 family)
VVDVTAAGSLWVPLKPPERRVVGVLVEKAKTTPEYYPMTVSAIVSACNQKSNRDPVTNYDQDDVEETLQGLRKKGAVILIEGSGRVPKWKHTLYEWLKVSKVELAVLAELLLRGPQMEGELRARASRMEPLEDLASLQAILDALTSRSLIHHLSPLGQRRGVFVTHGLYPPDELEKVRAAFGNRTAGDDEVRPRISTTSVNLSAVPVAPAWTIEVETLRSELEDLRKTVATLTAEVRELKSALGA